MPRASRGRANDVGYFTLQKEPPNCVNKCLYICT